MRTHRTTPLYLGLLALGATAAVGHAQTKKDSTARITAVSNVQKTPELDSAGGAPEDTAKKKRGGFMGKVKGLAKNKVVRTVAKVAACTVVPGGQFVAGAIDAAAAEGTAGAAQGVAGAATGSACMPGAGAAAGLAGGGIAGGAAGAVAGAAMPGGMPGGAMPMGLSAAQMAAMQASMAGGAMPMGLSPEQMAAMQASMAGGAMPMGISPEQMAAMQASMAGGAGMSRMMAPGMPGVGGAPTTEAPGLTVELSGDYAAELAKNKTVVRNIDWVAGAAGVSAAGTPAFTRAMSQLAGTMTQMGGSFRVDLYLDKRYDDAGVKSLGPQRQATISTALVQAMGAAGSAVVVESGKVKKDKNPRVEIVRRK